jgi:hypothetical protein
MIELDGWPDSAPRQSLTGHEAGGARVALTLEQKETHA